MEKEQNKNVELQKADELAKLGDKAFSSYNWKLSKSCVDSTPNPYSNDDWANDVSYPEHDLELAFDYYQQALVKYEMILGSDHIKVGEILFNCGRVAMEPMYDDSIALASFERALPIYMEHKQYSRDMAELYENMGSVCFSLNDLQSSLDYFNKSLLLYYKLSVCGEDVDVSKLKERISDAENKLGLHIVQKGNKCGFADKDNNIVIPCIWSDVQGFSEGFCGVKDDDQLCGFINYHGDLVIPCVYEDAYSFKNGMAYVVTGSDDNLQYSYYIDDEEYYIASDLELKPHQIEAVYKSVVLSCFEKHDEAVKAIFPALGTLDPRPTMRYLSYLYFAEEYDKLIEKCNKILKYDERSELVVLSKWILALCNEEGKGVEKNLIQAFRYYNSIRLDNNNSDEGYEILDDFLKRHPELQDLPEVQSALATFDEDDDF